MTDTAIVRANETANNALGSSLASWALTALPAKTQNALLRMFANPYLLEKLDKISLVEQLRDCVAKNPEVSELRVLLAMALCVNLEPQAAMEELGEAVALAPDSFIAHLKMGELWMRLRVCQKAADHTRQAALLAQNLAQSELARRQAATLRTMMRDGIERGGYKSPFAWAGRLRRLWTRNRDEELAPVEVR
jgi:hypothetical protein